MIHQFLNGALDTLDTKPHTAADKLWAVVSFRPLVTFAKIHVLILRCTCRYMIHVVVDAGTLSSPIMSGGLLANWNHTNAFPMRLRRTLRTCVKLPCWNSMGRMHLCVALSSLLLKLLRSGCILRWWGRKIELFDFRDARLSSSKL
jgi:hypothetical protein